MNLVSSGDVLLPTEQRLLFDVAVSPVKDHGL